MFHFTSLLTAPSGNCLCGLPWIHGSNCQIFTSWLLTSKSQLRTSGFLPRIPSLGSLHADIDYFSVPCLKFLTKLITSSSHISLATADKISLSGKEQVERDDGLLKHISKLKTRESISQWATAQGIACLAVLQLPND